MASHTSIGAELPSRLEVLLLRFPASSSNSLRVCARGVERSIYRGTSVFTGDTLAGRYRLCQRSLVAFHLSPFVPTLLLGLCAASGVVGD